MNQITEKLANLPIPWVLAIVAFLFVLRYVLLKQKSTAAKSVAEIAESLAVAMALVFLLIRPFIVQAFYIPSQSMEPTLLGNDRVHDHILVNKFIYRFHEVGRGDVVVFKSPPEARHNEADFIKRVVAVPGDTVRITPGYVLVGGLPYYHDDLSNMLAEYGTGTDPIRIKLQKGRVFVDGRLLTDAEIAKTTDNPKAKVNVVPGVVYLSGKALFEPYTAEDPKQPYPDEQTPSKWVTKDKQGRAIVKIPSGKLLVMGDNRNNSNDARSWGLLDRDRVLGKAMFIFWPVTRIRWVH